MRASVAILIVVVLVMTIDQGSAWRRRRSGMKDVLRGDPEKAQKLKDDLVSALKEVDDLDIDDITTGEVRDADKRAELVEKISGMV